MPFPEPFIEAVGLGMPFGLVRHAVTPDDDFQAQQKREIDRWRTAIEIVQRMREAGIHCELSDGLQHRH